MCIMSSSVVLLVKFGLPAKLSSKCRIALLTGEKGSFLSQISCQN